MRVAPMFASLEVCTTSRSALADLLARMYFWTRHSLSRSLVGRHPCWTAACFLPCTRPPDITRLRLRRPTRRPGPSERDARRAFTLTRSGFQTMPGPDADEDTASEAARGDGRVSRYLVPCRLMYFLFLLLPVLSRHALYTLGC